MMRPHDSNVRPTDSSQPKGESPQPDKIVGSFSSYAISK